MGVIADVYGDSFSFSKMQERMKQLEEEKARKAAESDNQVTENAPVNTDQNVQQQQYTPVQQTNIVNQPNNMNQPEYYPQQQQQVYNPYLAYLQQMSYQNYNNQPGYYPQQQQYIPQPQCNPYYQQLCAQQPGYYPQQQQYVPQQQVCAQQPEYYPSPPQEQYVPQQQVCVQQPTVVNQPGYYPQQQQYVPQQESNHIIRFGDSYLTPQEQLDGLEVMVPVECTYDESDKIEEECTYSNPYATSYGNRANCPDPNGLTYRYGNTYNNQYPAYYNNQANRQYFFNTTIPVKHQHDMFVDRVKWANAYYGITMTDAEIEEKINPRLPTINDWLATLSDKDIEIWNEFQHIKQVRACHEYQLMYGRPMTREEVIRERNMRALAEYHRKYDSHSLCEFLERDAGQMRFDYYIEQNCWPQRAFVRTMYTPNDYNTILSNNWTLYEPIVNGSMISYEYKNPVAENYRKQFGQCTEDNMAPSSQPYKSEQTPSSATSEQPFKGGRRLASATITNHGIIYEYEDEDNNPVTENYRKHVDQCIEKGLPLPEPPRRLEQIPSSIIDGEQFEEGIYSTPNNARWVMGGNSRVPVDFCHKKDENGKRYILFTYSPNSHKFLELDKNMDPVIKVYYTAEDFGYEVTPEEIQQQSENTTRILNRTYLHRKDGCYDV